MKNRLATELSSVFTLGRLAELACILEVTASKPGNVHRGADFEDVGLIDFLSSAVAMGQAIDSSHDIGYGETVLNVAQQTLKVTQSNTNLGMNLLITALVKAIMLCEEPPQKLNTQLMADFLKTLTLDDSQQVFEAIRLMKPGGLGSPDEHDVANEAAIPLIEAMQLAADRDSVAAQFVNDFEQVISDVPRHLVRGLELFVSPIQATVYAFVSVMSEEPDSLIARKCGAETAKKSQALAAKAIGAIESDATFKSFWRLVSEMDFWLRSDGHRRNPGTSADLVAAGLFVALYNGQVKPPFQ